MGVTPVTVARPRDSHCDGGCNFVVVGSVVDMVASHGGDTTMGHGRDVCYCLFVACFPFFPWH